VVACDYATGRRVPFGRAGAPQSDLADAVAASCAIPGFYYPVSIDGRRYVDGGMYSTSNLDLLRDEELDLVVCLNPTSSLHPTRAWNPAERAARVMRDASGRRLGSEAKKLRERGTEVVLIQPTHADLEAMGPNLMSSKDRNPVIATARETVGAQLEAPAHRDLLADLPKGDERRVRRPPGDPADWPDLDEIRQLVRERTSG
jgi:NTE family protein